MFPFGRKRFSFELLPLLQSARSCQPAALVVSSVRDVLVKKPDQAKHEDRVCRLVNDYYDLVLVHGDERLFGLEETFSRVPDLRCEIRYTGYVSPAARLKERNHSGGDSPPIGNI
ncbi:MAG TPA: hypothetical protein VMX16_14965 [Terriglobia bacterium]|nr:hypothetical protein [Terriglobia bacterium]